MRILRSADGAALVTALLLTMLALVISMALLYSITTGTKITANQKRYRSALAAAHGGVELFGQEIIPRLLMQNSALNSVIGDFSSIDMQLPQYACLRQKLVNPTAHWTGCSAAQSSADPTQSPDVTFTLRAQPQEQGFSVSAKIVDTLPGNTDLVSDALLDTGISVAGKDEVIHPQQVPSLYNLSVQGVRDGGGSREKALLSVLYAY